MGCVLRRSSDERSLGINSHRPINQHRVRRRTETGTSSLYVAVAAGCFRQHLREPNETRARVCISALTCVRACIRRRAASRGPTLLTPNLVEIPFPLSLFHECAADDDASSIYLFGMCGCGFAFGHYMRVVLYSKNRQDNRNFFSDRLRSKRIVINSLHCISICTKRRDEKLHHLYTIFAT